MGDERLYRARARLHVVGDNLESVTLSIDGTLVFDADLDQWPTSPGSDAVLGCILLRNATGVTITSATEGGGVLDGRGDKWSVRAAGIVETRVRASGSARVRTNPPSS